MIEAGGPAVAAVARARIRRRWLELVAIGLVAGLVGGIAIGAFAGARRGSTAYDRLVATSDHPDLLVRLIEPRPGLVEDVAALPSVERAVSATSVVGARTDVPGRVLIPVQTSAEPVADLPIVVGRAADPGAVDEAVISSSHADELGLAVGDELSHHALTDAEFADLLRDRWDGSTTGLENDLRIVGIVRSPTDVTLAEFPTLTGTPALHERLAPLASGSMALWVHLGPGVDAASFEEQLVGVTGEGSEERLNATSVIDLGGARRSVDDATGLLSTGMVVFGVLVVLAGVALLAQLVSRTAEEGRREAAILGDLGMDQRKRHRAWLISCWPVLGVATLTAVIVAVLTSAATPLGVARSIEPDPGVDVNVAMLAAGVIALALSVAGIWSVVVRTRRVSQRRRPVRAGRFLGSGAGPEASVVVAMALGPAERRGARWLGIVGIATSVTGLVGVSIFGASLTDLVEDPRRWGWFGELSIEVPEPLREDVYAALDAAPEVDGYAEVQSLELTVEGRVVGAYAVVPRRGDVTPVVRRGRAPVSSEEMVIGPRLADELGVDLGDRVETRIGERTVVGLGPTLGIGDTSDNVSGVLLGGTVEAPDYTTAVVRLARGVDPEDFPATVYPDAEYSGPVVPSDVTNLRELETLPPLLLGTFAVIGVVAVVHMARSTAGRSRRDVAVLRSLGLPRRRASRVVLAATTLTALVAAAVGAPLGVVAGARTWSAVAAGSDLGTDVTAPGALLVLAPALVLVVGVAGIAAGRRSVATIPGGVLRSE